jgi:Family of unknown function (DUF5309)
MFRLAHLTRSWQAAVMHAVAANALETYDSITIREDLSDAENMISPTETPFMSKIAGSNTATNKYHEWPLLELTAVDSSNRVAEGEDAPAVDAPDLAFRRGNYTQISDKVVKVSDTSQRVDGAANIEKMSKQIAYKLKELKRDKESMLTTSVAAVPGVAVGNTVRVAAGFVTFIKTNRQMGATGTAPTLSGTNNGYPNAVGGAGTATALTEDQLNTAIQASWNAGGDPKYALVSPTNKRLISKTFTANSTKYKDADDKKLISAVDFYESDFGTIQIVPSRFMRSTDVLIIDPEFVKISVLQPTRQMDLARTGHTENKLIQSEYTLEVGNEKAHAAIVDTQG